MYIYISTCPEFQRCAAAAAGAGVGAAAVAVTVASLRNSRKVSRRFLEVKKRIQCAATGSVAARITTN